MNVNDFNYHLPEKLIAQTPSENRENSKMMVLNRHTKTIEHSMFCQISDYLKPNDLLIVNNTKVIPARLFGKKTTGAKIEIFLLKKAGTHSWECLLSPQKRISTGTEITLNNGESIKALEKTPKGNWLIETSNAFDQHINEIGNMPLPPYIKRESEHPYKNIDQERYQTVYAKNPGAVAAPTAGLHFTDKIMQQLQKQQINIAEITLHVGLGTFKPIKCDKVEDHIMHEEYYSVTQETADMINTAKQNKHRVIAIGTTSIRTLETIASLHYGKMTAHSGWSDIFIFPGFQFKIVDACITNFHLPKSTLIMLVSALAGRDFVFEAYQKAIESQYRFFSYGDCMLIT